MTESPLVSIVIPHFNRSELLVETLHSIRTQSYPNWEVVIVDDGSGQDEWRNIQSLADDRVRVLQRIDGLKGPSRCRNLGAAASRGGFLLFVDSDDILAPWCLLERICQAQQGSDTALWVFPVMLFNRYPGDLEICWNRLEGNDDLERFLRSDPPWHTSSGLWRRKTFIGLGGFNERVMYGDDAELHTRALLQGTAVRKYPRCLPDVFIRRGETPRITSHLSSAVIESRRVRLRAGTKLLDEHHAPEQLRGLWEGQYFVECEELFFNAKVSRQNIRAVIDDWVEFYRPPRFREWLVRSYFLLAVWLRPRAYLMLRIARRLMMLMLPKEFFPLGGYFQNWGLAEDKADRIKALLEEASKRGRNWPGFSQGTGVPTHAAFRQR
ncbi:glycosyltransferase family 2 protein [Elongatibacter sediminis]|uniref:Glycosyltransferase n=1 Tax=Elongatibacter sediminis TaxID=3119006 RepID=A0AAW9RHB3_9GAMM